MEKSRSISEDLRRSRQERGDQEERSHRVIVDFPVLFQAHRVFPGVVEAVLYHLRSETAMQLVGSRSWGLPATADETDPQTLLKLRRRPRFKP